MTNIRYWQGIGLCGLSAFALGAAAQDGETKWGPHIDFEAKPGSKRSLGEADLFIPLSQDNRTLVFADLRARFDNNDSREGNLGLGVRRMMEGGWNLGAYGYFDRRRSPDTRYYYNQATLGAEALGRDWDFRANGYLPQGTRVRDLGTTPGVSSATISGASILVTTSAAITREERALKGFDGEVGWRAPLFDSEAARQLRLYAGGYRFSDDVTTVEGPRLRAELAMDDLTWFGKGTGLFLGLEAQNDGARGHQNFLSLRLRIPLGKESTRPTLSAQERRMTAPVMRDVDIVTQGRSFVSTPAVVETATATAGGQTITVLNSATTSGAALPGAVAAAGANSTVILSGSFTTNSNATGIVALQSGQTLMGAGTLTVATPSGRTATLTTSGATITGNVGGANYTVAMANNSTLTGLTINNTDAFGTNANGVVANGVSGARIVNNTINATETGGGIAHGVDVFWGSSNITVSGNTITVSGGGGIFALGVQVIGASATVTGNTLSASGASTNYHTELNNANVLAGSSGNTVIAGNCDIGAAGIGTTVSYTNAANCGP